MTPKDAFYKVGTGIHRVIFNVSNGRIFGKAFGMPLIELVTTGRRSGKERATMLSVPIIDGDRMVLIASFGGEPMRPRTESTLTNRPSCEHAYHTGCPDRAPTDRARGERST